MSSTNRGYQRHKSDYYVTPQKAIRRFFRDLEEDEFGIFDNSFILDPCAGGDKTHEMSYPTVIDEEYKYRRLETIDIREDSRANTIADYRTLNVGKVFGENPDVIITNPPFKIALPIIKKGLNDVKEGGFVIMLLRLNFFGSQKRFKFWRKKMPKYCFVHHKRMSFTDKGGTDSIEYCHMVWQKGNSKEFGKIKVI